MKEVWVHIRADGKQIDDQGYDVVDQFDPLDFDYWGAYGAERLAAAAAKDGLRAGTYLYEVRTESERRGRVLAQGVVTWGPPDSSDLPFSGVNSI